MKKQRILALTLAATTAMSMFGGMSASAANYDEPYVSGSYAVGKVDFATVKAENIFTGTPTEAYEAGIETGIVYLFDYAPADQDAVNWDDVVAAVEDAALLGDTSAAATLTTYFGTATPTPVTTTAFELSSKSVRKTVLEAFLDEKAILDDMDEAMYNSDDWAYYCIDDLKADVKSAKLPTSELVYLASEIDRVTDFMVVVTSHADMYYNELDKVNAFIESDYTAANYKALQGEIALAEFYAGNEDYVKALDILKKAQVKYGPKAVRTAKLQAAIKALFNGTVPADADAVYPAKGEKYVAEKYDEAAWIAFAGYGTDKDAWDYEEGAYRAARRVLANKDKRQSDVDAALEALEAAVADLVWNYDTPAWVLVKLETEFAEATKDVVASDYRETSRAYKNYFALVEKIENMLADAHFTEADANKAMTDLAAARKALNAVAIPVPSALKNEYKALVKEGNTLLKDKTNSTYAQIDALQKALAAKPGNRLSSYEAVVADLKAAVEGYKQTQGFYTVDGKTYYGQGAEKVTGWLHLGADYYYFNAEGVMSANKWEFVNNNWYYFFGSGKMVAGRWHEINGKWYAFKDWGGMRTGWFKSPDNDNWFYLQSNGAMVADGWYWINGKCYYFYENGSMAVNTTINGYKVDASGAWVK